MPAATDPPLGVHLLAVGETTPGVLYGLLEVFSAVGVGWTELTGERTDTRPVRASIVVEDGGVAEHRGTFVTAKGVPLAPATVLSKAGASDVVIVTDLDLGSPSFDPRGRWPRETAWLRERFHRGATVCSVCTGSVLLAEAGLLEDQEATTHWGAGSMFAEHYPRVHLRADRILCPTGPEHRIITSGGSATWTDLAIYLIARFCGAAEAVRISKIFVIGDHTEGQLPFAASARSRYHEDAVIEAGQAWIAEHYARPRPVEGMVRVSGLSERTFKRRFKAATGYSPVEYVQTLRIEEAKQMLEASGGLVDDIAGQVGYQDPAFFRRLFKRRTGVTPARYRQRFRSIGDRNVSDQ